MLQSLTHPPFKGWTFIANPVPTVDGRNPANHQGCTKPCDWWDKLPTSTGWMDLFHQQYPVTCCHCFAFKISPKITRIGLGIWSTQVPCIRWWQTWQPGRHDWRHWLSFQIFCWKSCLSHGINLFKAARIAHKKKAPCFWGFSRSLLSLLVVVFVVVAAAVLFCCLLFFCCFLLCLLFLFLFLSLFLFLFWFFFFLVLFLVLVAVVVAAASASLNSDKFLEIIHKISVWNCGDWFLLQGCYWPKLLIVYDPKPENIKAIRGRLSTIWGRRLRSLRLKSQW